MLLKDSYRTNLSEASQSEAFTNKVGKGPNDIASIVRFLSYNSKESKDSDTQLLQSSFLSSIYGLIVMLIAYITDVR